MRRLLVIVLAAAALYGCYWFIGASSVERGLAGWFESRQDDGWVASYTELETRGFPNRFDTTITDLELADPQTGVAWSAPFFQILSLSYRPNHIIAVWPKEQVIASPYQKFRITSDTARGSIVFVPNTSLELDRSSIELADIQITSSDAWSAGLASGQFATRRTIGGENTHDIFFEAVEFRPSESLHKWLDPGSLLPKTFDNMKLDMAVGFDAPWDRFSIEQRRPQPINLDLKLLQAKWGGLDLYAAGDLDIDAEGKATGRIEVRAKNWRQMLQIGVDTGAVPQSVATTVEKALEFLSNLSGDPDTIEAPLSFSDGWIAFGPFPLGPAPRFWIR